MIEILPLKKQYELIDQTLEERLNTILPLAMKESGIDMWIVLAKEYNEDPVLKFLTYTSFPTARRLTCLIFYDNGSKVERYHAGRPDPSLNQLYQPIWKLNEEKQFDCIKRIINEKKPNKIGINISDTFAFADGLTKSLYDELVTALDKKTTAKLVSAEKLCIRYLETRTEQELARYYTICNVAEQIIRKTFSRKVIKPYLTTTKDIEWFMMQTVNSLGLKFWFNPTIDIQRKDIGYIGNEEVIIPGDLIHCDFGLVYLGLCTDTQRLGYVLSENETAVPNYLLEVMKTNNHFQDIVTNNFKTGLSGNDILMNSLKQAKKENIVCKLYSHPIGTHGHGPGPTIGLFNQQEPIVGKGEYPLYLNTCYALELQTIHWIKEWNTNIMMMTEETIEYTKDGVKYLMSGRKEIICI